VRLGLGVKVVLAEAVTEEVAVLSGASPPWPPMEAVAEGVPRPLLPAVVEGVTPLLAPASDGSLPDDVEGAAPAAGNPVVVCR
jgi:hypothetical protein